MCTNLTVKGLFIYQVLDGMPIGSSLYDEEGAAIVPQLMEKAKANNVRIHLPTDFITGNRFAPDAEVNINHRPWYCMKSEELLFLPMLIIICSYSCNLIFEL